MTLYHLLILAALLGSLGMLLWNLSRFETVPVRPEAEPDAPFVSILVPARNEEGRIGRCAGSLAAQGYPRFEVLVLDDHSEDGTAAVVRDLGFSEEPGVRLRLLKGEPLSPGWTGKGWACHQLAAAARGEYLLFIDADTAHRPEMLASTVAHARHTRADLLSAWPKLLTGTWSEKLVLPLIHLALAFYPHAWFVALLEDPERARRLPRTILRGLGAANGQFLLFRREAYLRIGGHAAIKSHLVEDVALGREVALRAGEGMRLINCDGSRLSEVRMYTSFAEVWEGLTKNVRAAFEGSLFLYLLSGVWMTLVFLLPFAWVWTVGGASFWLVLAQIAVIYAIRARIALRFSTSPLGAALHPLAQVLMVAIALNSWRCSAGHGVTWKGRRYEVIHPGA